MSSRKKCGPRQKTEYVRDIIGVPGYAVEEWAKEEA